MKFIEKQPMVIDVVKYEPFMEDGLLNLIVGNLTPKQKEIVKEWYPDKNINELDDDSIVQVPFIRAYNLEGELANRCIGENHYIATDLEGDKIILTEHELLENFSFYGDGETDNWEYEINTPTLTEFAENIMDISKEFKDGSVVAVMDASEGSSQDIYNVVAFGEVKDIPNKNVYTIVLKKANKKPVKIPKLPTPTELAEEIGDMIANFIKNSNRI